MQSIVVDERTQAYYFVYPMMKNKIPSVFTGHTYEVLNIVLRKALFAMQIRQTGLGWFLKTHLHELLSNAKADFCLFCLHFHFSLAVWFYKLPFITSQFIDPQSLAFLSGSGLRDLTHTKNKIPQNPTY